MSDRTGYRTERAESRGAKTVAWKRIALCRTKELDPEMFFPEENDTKGIKKAKAVCRNCPVAEPCLTYAMTWPFEKLGVWGGLTESERENLRRRRRRTA